MDVGAVAAEFVLGTLYSEERARANTLLESDPHFRGMVGAWERRLGELHLMAEPADPPPPTWESIKSKLERRRTKSRRRPVRRARDIGGEDEGNA